MWGFSRSRTQKELVDGVLKVLSPKGGCFRNAMKDVCRQIIWTKDCCPPCNATTTRSYMHDGRLVFFARFDDYCKHNLRERVLEELKDEASTDEGKSIVASWQDTLDAAEWQRLKKGIVKLCKTNYPDLAEWLGM